MPQLPVYQRRVIEQRSAAGPAQATVNQGLQQFTQGLGQFAQVQATMQAREARDYTLESQNTTAVGLAQEKETLNQNVTSGSEYITGLESYIDSQKQAAIDKAPNQRAQQEVTAYYDRLKATELERAIPQAAKMNAKRSAKVVTDNINLSLAETYRDPGSYEANLQNGIDVIMTSDIPEANKEAAISEYTNSLNVKRVQGMIDKSPATALSQLQSGEFDSTLNPDQLTQLTRSAEAQAEAAERQRIASQNQAAAEAKAQQDAKNASVQSDLEINISRGNAGYVEIEKAYEDGVITPEKRTQLTKQVDTRAIKQEKVNIGIELVSAAVNGGQPLDYNNPDHQSAVDNYYSNLPEDSRNDINVVSSVVKSTKVIPSQVETTLNSQLRGDSNMRVEAANNIARLNEVAPEAVASLPQDTKAMGIGISKLVSAGVDPSRASELVYNSVYNTTKEQKDVLSFQLSQKDMKSKVSNKFKGAVDKISSSFFSPKRTQSMNSMEAEFNSAVNQYYMLTHDIDSATELATTDISATWGTTWVDGKERVMKYSPEKIYGNGGETPWIYNQLESELKEIGIESKYSLQADAITAREGKPSYIITTEQDGVMMPLMVDGQVMRYTPDFTSTPEAANMVVEKAEAMERARVRQSTLDTYGTKTPKPQFGNYGYEVTNAN